MESDPITIADTPIMPQPEVEHLTKRLRKTRCFLEYGAGGSTALAARLNVAKIYSVESDFAYVEAVRAKVASLGSTSEHQAMYLDIGATGRFGHPLDGSGRERWSAYSAQVWDTIAAAGDVPDTILVDGRFRVACCLFSLMRMPDNGKILFDDYFDREDQYGIVTRFAPVRRRIGRMAVFNKPRNLDLAKIEKVYRSYAEQPA